MHPLTEEGGEGSRRNVNENSADASCVGWFLCRHLIEPAMH